MSKCRDSCVGNQANIVAECYTLGLWPLSNRAAINMFGGGAGAAADAIRGKAGFF